ASLASFTSVFGDHLYLHSFPTRRSSDLISSERKHIGELNYIFCDDAYLFKLNVDYLDHDTLTDIISFDYSDHITIQGDIFISIRSEEHTSELQSRENLVCRLLLEKKKHT